MTEYLGDRKGYKITIMFSSFSKWTKKIAVFRALRNVDFIGSIDDMQYYRIANKTNEPIILKVKDSHKLTSLPGKFTIQPGEKRFLAVGL